MFRSSFFFAMAAGIALFAPAGFAQDSAPAGSQPSKPWMKTETRLRLFAPAWRRIGQQTPQEAAKKFHIIYGHYTAEEFHEGNPDSKVIKYILGPYATKTEMEKLPREALGSDKDGNVVKARDWENWLIVPDNPKWIEHVQGMVKELMKDDRYDGLFTDSMGTAPVESSYLLAEPINPNTGEKYTAEEWITAERKMVAAIQEILPEEKLLTMNGLGSGDRYWREPYGASPRALLDPYDGAMSETIWRHPRTPLTAWPSVEKWMSEIRMIQDVEKRGIMGFWWTKCWSDGNTSNNEPDAETLVPQWRRLALGSYLLAAGPNSYFNFDTVKNDEPESNAAEYFVEYDAPLGIATGEMTQVGETGVYYRQFENGLVVVNPNDKAIADVSIDAAAGKSYKSWGEDRSVQFPSSVEAHTGLILTVE